MWDDRPSRQNTASEEVPKFAFYELRNIPVPFTLAGQECFQMSGNNSVDRILFGIARPVDLLATHEHMAECKPARILLSSRDNNLQGAGWEKSGWIAITPSRLSRLCRLFRGLSCGHYAVLSLLTP